MLGARAELGTGGSPHLYFRLLRSLYLAPGGETMRENHGLYSVTEAAQDKMTTTLRGYKCSSGWLVTGLAVKPVRAYIAGYRLRSISCAAAAGFVGNIPGRLLRYAQYLVRRNCRMSSTNAEPLQDC